MYFASYRFHNLFYKSTFNTNKFSLFLFIVRKGWPSLDLMEVSLLVWMNICKCQTTKTYTEAYRRSKSNKYDGVLQTMRWLHDSLFWLSSKKFATVSLRLCVHMKKIVHLFTVFSKLFVMCLLMMRLFQNLDNMCFDSFGSHGVPTTFAATRFMGTFFPFRTK